MNLKKSIFSYIVWAAFAPLCCLGIVFALNAAGVRDILGWPLAAINGGVCAYLLFIVAVFFALRIICGEIHRHIKNRQRVEMVLSVVLPVLILIGVVVYLVLYLMYHVPLTLEDDSFYRKAVVSAGQSVPFSVHGTNWLYPSLLHVMLFIFGNTPFAGVVLQIVLFFICLLFLYIGMQAFVGVIPASVSMAAFAFLPVSLRYVFSLTPELFYLSLYLIGFGFAGALYGKFRRGASSSAQDILALFFGFYVGFLIYLDIYSVSLFFFLVVLYSVDREKIRQAFVSGMLALLGGMGGFILSVIVVSYTQNMTFSGYLEDLWAFYGSNVGFEIASLENVLLMPDTTFICSLLLISLAFFVIPAFFVWKKAQNSALILNLFLVYCLSILAISKTDMQMIMTLAWCILAGAGVYGVIRRPEQSLAEENVMSEKKRSEEKENLPEKSQEQEQKTPAPGEPLPNPLPVPKKKSRPPVDFGYQVKEADMKFDIEIIEGDDFDV